MNFNCVTNIINRENKLQNSANRNVKRKVIPLHAMGALGVRGGIAASHS
jgi:hypothetical protein